MNKMRRDQIVWSWFIRATMRLKAENQTSRIAFVEFCIKKVNENLCDEVSKSFEV